MPAALATTVASLFVWTAYSDCVTRWNEVLYRPVSFVEGIPFCSVESPGSAVALLVLALPTVLLLTRDARRRTTPPKFASFSDAGARLSRRAVVTLGLRDRGDVRWTRGNHDHGAAALVEMYSARVVMFYEWLVHRVPRWYRAAEEERRTLEREWAQGPEQRRTRRCSRADRPLGAQELRGAGRWKRAGAKAPR